MQEIHNTEIYNPNIHNTNILNTSDIYNTNIYNTNNHNTEIHNTDVEPLQPLQPVYYENSYRQSDTSLNFTNPMTQSFIGETWAIEKDLDVILSNISTIQSIQTQITVSTSKSQELSLISSRDAIMNATKDLLNMSKDRVKSLEIQDLKINRTSTTTEDVELRKQRINHLKEKFVTCLNTFRNIGNLYMKQQKERMSRQYKIVNPDADNEEVEEYLKNPTDQPVFLQGAVGQRKSIRDSSLVLEEVNKRHHDIKRIEETISELVDLFKEIQMQVELKDDIAVSMAEEVQSVEHNMRGINDELEKAEEVASSSRKFKWLCAVFTLMLFGSIVVLIVILTTRK